MTAVTNADVMTALLDLHEAHLELLENLRGLQGYVDEMERKVDKYERNAFDFGVDAGAAGLVKPSAAMLADVE